MDKIGAILKNRISEMSMTQEEFAERAGIACSTLKKYMSGKVAYNYVMLQKFADILNCSYDYLLGYSESTRRDIQSIKDTICLKEDVIDKLKKIAHQRKTGKKEDREIIAAYFEALNALIEFDAISAISLYFSSDEEVQKTDSIIKENFDNDIVVSVKDVLCFAVIDSLTHCRDDLIRQRKNCK